MEIITNTVNRILMRPKEESGSGWDTAAKTMVCLALFLSPIMVGWWTSDIWETHKMLLLLVTISGGWICYWIGALGRRTVSWHWHQMDWLVVAIVAITGLSTLTSIRPLQAFMPFGGWYAETLPGVMVLASLYLLTVQLFRGRHDQLMGWASLLGGLVVVSLLQIFQFSGFSLWPLTLPTNPLFSPLNGSIDTLAVFAAMFGSIALLGWPLAREKWQRLVIIAGVAIGWLTVMIAGQTLGWSIFALGMILVVLSQARRGAQANARLIGLAVGLAVLGMVTQFTNLSSYTSIKPVSDAKLNTTSSAAITWSTVVKQIPFGSGPGTWFYDFVSSRPQSFNQTPFWNVRFAQAGSAWWQLAATTGIFGVLAWFTWLVMVVVTLWRRWQSDGEWIDVVGLMIALTVLVTSFFTTWSLVLLVMLFGSFGLRRAARPSRAKPLPLNIWSGLGFALTMVLVLAWWYPAGRILASEIVTNQAVQAINRVEPIAKVETRLERALQLNKHNLNAASLLANAYLVDLQLNIQKKDTALTQASTQKIAQHLNFLKQLDPKNPSVYEISNNVLSSLTGVVGDVELEAQRNFLTLRQLEPTSPIHEVGYGQTLMVERSRILAGEKVTDDQKNQAEKLRQQAIVAYDQAINKKSDYLQAHSSRIIAMTAGGEFDQALAYINPLIVLYPQNSGLWVQQADILSQLNRGNEAVAAYEQAILQDNNTDSTIYLAYAGHYQSLKDKVKTKEILERGLKTFPGDSQLQAALDSLK